MKAESIITHMASPVYKVVWQVPPLQDVEILANLIAGLARLKAAGEVSLEIVPSARPFEGRHTMLLEIQRITDGERRFAVVEVLDRADDFDMTALAESAIYFKCNFQAREVSQLPPHLRGRVRPLGLALLCVVDGSAGVFTRVAWSAMRSGLSRNGIRGFRNSVDASLRNLSLLWGGVTLPEMRPALLSRPEMNVVFQPRGWSEDSADKVAANARRADMVRQLRAAFGGRDIIGFMRSRVENSISAELYLPRHIARAQYIDLLKSTAIGVNSRGLNDSSTFKLSEYLAAGMAIVSDEMKFELPVPLVEGVNFLRYETPAECVDCCNELLSNPDRLAGMRAANYEYFAKNLEPEVQVRYLLAEAFDGTHAGSR